MRRRPSLIRPARSATLAVAIAVCATAAAPSPASALDPVKPICGLAGWVSGLAGKACGVLQGGGKLIGAGKKLLGGHVGGAVKTLLGDSGAPKASTVIGLAAIGAWVLVGAKSALNETAKLIGQSTSPRLGTTWFSSTYWRMTALAALLTLPFLFAAAVQAMMRSDLALLARAALGYLPLAMLAVSVAAPLTMLLLAASDEMSAIVSSAGRNGGVRFLQHAGLAAGTLSVLAGSPFLAFLVGLFTVAGAIVLWAELMMREAAVYVVVLMLPLAFSALVWPARRIWAIRAVELLVALILSKFAIVAVLSLAGAALGQSGSGGIGTMLTGMVLVTLGAFAPWAVLRLLPLAELASGAAGHLRGEMGRVRMTHEAADAVAGAGADWAGSLTAGMRRQAQDTPQAGADHDHANGGSAELAKLAAIPGAAADPPGPPVDEAPPADRGGATPGGSGAGGSGAGGIGAGGIGAGGIGAGGIGAPGGGGGTGGTPTPGWGPSASGEQLPALDEMIQAPDMSWRPFMAGTDDGWPPRPVWPAGEVPAPDPLESHGESGRSPEPPADDPDPRPPEQEPPEGPL